MLVHKSIYNRPLWEWQNLILVHGLAVQEDIKVHGRF